MADVIKKATRDGYGEALVELMDEYPNLVVLDADLAAARNPVCLRRRTRSASSTAGSQRGT